MNVEVIIQQVQELGVRLSVNGDKLRLEPKGVATPELMEMLRAHKLEVIAHLVLQRGSPTAHHMLPRKIGCVPCTCDEYIIHRNHNLVCPACQGNVCARCEFCLNASHIWRHTERELVRTGAPLPELLARLKNGHRWLIEQHEKAYQGAAGVDPDLLSKALDTWADLEKELRQVHGYTACIYGDGEKCPGDAPVLCDACVKD